RALRLAALHHQALHGDAVVEADAALPAQPRERLRELVGVTRLVVGRVDAAGDAFLHVRERRLDGHALLAAADAALEAVGFELACGRRRLVEGSGVRLEEE